MKSETRQRIEALIEGMDSAAMHEFACRCAEAALAQIASRDAVRRAPVPGPDPRSVAAVETKRRWLRGEATDEELAAACAAALGVAWSTSERFDAPDYHVAGAAAWASEADPMEAAVYAAEARASAWVCRFDTKQGQAEAEAAVWAQLREFAGCEAACAA